MPGANQPVERFRHARIPRVRFGVIEDEAAQEIGGSGQLPEPVRLLCGLRPHAATEESRRHPRDGVLQQVRVGILLGEEGFNVAFECAAVEASLDDAVQNIQKRGLIVVLAVYGERPRVDMAVVNDRELTITGDSDVPAG